MCSPLLAALLTLALAGTPPGTDGGPPDPGPAVQPPAAEPAPPAVAPAPPTLAPPAAAVATSPAPPARGPAVEFTLALGLWGPLAASHPQNSSGSIVTGAVALAWEQVALELSGGYHGASRLGVADSGSECAACATSHEMAMVPVTLSLRGYFAPPSEARLFVMGGAGYAMWRETTSNPNRVSEPARAVEHRADVVVGLGADLALSEAVGLRLAGKLHVVGASSTNTSWPSYDVSLGLVVRGLGWLAPRPAGPATPPEPPDPALQAELSQGPTHWAERPSLSLRAGALRMAPDRSEYGGFSTALDLEAAAGWRLSRHLAVEVSAGWLETSAPGATYCPICATTLEVVPLLAGVRAILPAGRLEFSIAAGGGVTRVVERAGYPTGGPDWGSAAQGSLAGSWRLVRGLRAGLELGWLQTWHRHLGPGDLSPGGPRVRALVEWIPGRMLAAPRDAAP